MVFFIHPFDQSVHDKFAKTLHRSLISSDLSVLGASFTVLRSLCLRFYYIILFIILYYQQNALLTSWLLAQSVNPQLLSSYFFSEPRFEFRQLNF